MAEVFLHSIYVETEGLSVPDTIRYIPKKESLIPSMILFGAAGLTVIGIAAIMFRRDKQIGGAPAKDKA